METLTKKQNATAAKIIAAEKISYPQIYDFDGVKYLCLDDAEPTSRCLQPHEEGLDEWAANAVNLSSGELCIIYWMHDPDDLDEDEQPEDYNWDNVDRVFNTGDLWEC